MKQFSGESDWIHLFPVLCLFTLQTLQPSGHLQKKKNKYKKTTNKQNKDKEQFGPEGKQKTKRIGLIQLT